MHAPAFPTVEHERAARAIAECISTEPAVDAVLLTGSRARGKPSSDGCLDKAVLVAHGTISRQRRDLATRWIAYDKWIHEQLVSILGRPEL